MRWIVQFSEAMCKPLRLKCGPRGSRGGKGERKSMGTGEEVEIERSIRRKNYCEEMSCLPERWKALDDQGLGIRRG